MRIEQVELREVRLPLVHPFETSFGREVENRVVIVKVWGEGLVGYGESAETVSTCWNAQLAGMYCQEPGLPD